MTQLDDLERSPDNIDGVDVDVDDGAGIKLEPIASQSSPGKSDRLVIDDFDVTTKDGFKELMRF